MSNKRFFRMIFSGVELPGINFIGVLSRVILLPRRVGGILLLAALFSGAAAAAETVYVTDMLQLEMYLNEDMSGSPIRKLRSGDKLEMLASNGRYAQVRSEDGQQGWVKSLYLVETEPARTRVNQLERDNGSLEATVKKLREQLVGQQAQFDELQQRQSGSAEQKAATEQELEKLRAENSALTEKLSGYTASVPANWLLIAMLVALVGGLAGGWYFVDRRSRARHGGYRIY